MTINATIAIMATSHRRSGRPALTFLIGPLMSRNLPLAKTITAEGIEDVSEDTLRSLIEEVDRSGGERIAHRR